MNIHRVFLSEKIEEKIWREHHVERWEVFDIFYNDEHKIYRRSLERRRYWVALGKTTAGRLLAVFYVLREGVAYIATAYDMPARYRRIYHKESVMRKMNKKLEEELEEWAYLAETYPDKVLDEMEEIDVIPHLKRERVFFSLAPHVVEALKQRAMEEEKSISFLVEQWLIEKLFIEKPVNIKVEG